MPSKKSHSLSPDSPRAQTDFDNHKFSDGCSSLSSSISSNGFDICRICHCEGDAEVPLITPCYCAGSLRFVHQACLQQWIKSSNTRNCELCKFQFIMHTKTKPFTEWEQLDMSGLERRKLFCAVLFHAVALTCVVWSSYVLIDRTVEEVRNGVLEWPLWTKLIVVSIGITGGVIFMYIQCKAYIQICQRWKAYNRVIYVQDAPPRLPTVPALGVVPVSSITAGSSRLTDGGNSDLLTRPLFDCQWKPYQDNFDCPTHRHGAAEGEATNIDFKGVRNVRIFFDNDNGIHLSKGDDCINVNVNDTYAATSSNNKSVSLDTSKEGEHGGLSWRIEINKTAKSNAENAQNASDNYDRVLPPVDANDSRDVSKTHIISPEASAVRNGTESSSAGELPVLKLLIKIADIVIQFGGQAAGGASASDPATGEKAVSSDAKATGCDGKSVNIQIDNPSEATDPSDQTPFIIDLTSQLEQQVSKVSKGSGNVNPVKIRFDFGAEANGSGGESDSDLTVNKASTKLLPSSELKKSKFQEPFSSYVSYPPSLESDFKNDSDGQISLNESNDSCTQLLLKHSDDNAVLTKV